MRTLSKSECAFIGGGGAVTPLTKTSPTAYTSNSNGIVTTVTCTTPFAAGLSLGVSAKGKLVNLNGGATIDTQSCTVTTVDTTTHMETICQGTDCKVINLTTGKQVSETTVSDGDTGIAQLAQADGGDSEAFAGYDFSGSAGGDDGGGLAGGGDPGSGGGGGGGGEPEEGDGDGGMMG